jgi:hypothetical protein
MTVSSLRKDGRSSRVVRILAVFARQGDERDSMVAKLADVGIVGSDGDILSFKEESEVRPSGTPSKH